MKTYVRLLGDSVVEVIAPVVYEDDSPPGIEPVYKKGEEIPIDRRYHPLFVAALIEVPSSVEIPEQGWIYDGAQFTAHPSA